VEDPRGDEQRHQPPPSLWPVGFAVGIVCLLVGLIVSWIVAAVGAGLALVFGFLWAREVLAAGREPTVTEPTEGDGSPTAAAIPAHEGEAAMPEPDPVERYPRNVFLEMSTLGLGALIGGIVTLPVLGFAVLPAFTKQGAKEIDLGPMTDFPEGQYVVATFESDASEGEISRRSAFIRNNGMTNGVPSFTCISNRCVHLGCPVQPGGPVFDSKKQTVRTKIGPVDLIPALPAAGFICPCHGGAYDQEGNRTAGPPVRALNRYHFLIRDGHLILNGTYSVAKVDGTGGTAKIHTYQTAGPGQHVDGPEAWLYPVQPPH
jgi:quinol---cytochrome c reductase iron-sulfur subunit, bacillus type